MGSLNTRWSNRIITACIALLVAVLVSQVVSAYFLPSRATLHLGSGKFTATIADRESTRMKGLSGSESLPSDHAMVLVFDTSSRWGIWMKDMQYPIDVVWLNESKKVVDFVMNVPADSYPKVFTPKEDARYIVELKSGTIKTKEIRVGQEAVFSGTNKEL